MQRIDIPPLHAWERRHPLPRQIAAQIPQPMLALSTGLLVSDIRERFACCDSTAMTAVSLARQAHG